MLDEEELVEGFLKNKELKWLITFKTPWERTIKSFYNCLSTSLEVGPEVISNSGFQEPFIKLGGWLAPLYPLKIVLYTIKVHDWSRIAKYETNRYNILSVSCMSAFGMRQLLVVGANEWYGLDIIQLLNSYTEWGVKESALKVAEIQH